MGCDSAWCAGFLDGEGTFLLAPVERSGQRTPGVLRRRPMVSCSQSLMIDPLEKLRANLGGSIVKATRLTRTGRPVWIWNLQSATSLRRALPLLIPHLTVKRRAAEILLAHAETFGGRGKLTADVLAKRLAIEAEFYALPERRVYYAARRAV